jgi:hypothetical protein
MNEDKTIIMDSKGVIVPIKENSGRCYFFTRFWWTGVIWLINIFQVYVVASIEEVHGLWLFLTLFAFLNILLELGVFYRLSQQPPDSNGMVTRFPYKQTSVVQLIPVQNGDTDDKPLILSANGSANDYMIAFKDTKVRLNHIYFSQLLL